MEKTKKPSWHPIIVEIIHKDKEDEIPFPVFIWKFGIKEDSFEKSRFVGEIRIFSLRKTFLFNVSGGIIFKKESISEVLAPYGWEKPPFFDEIAKSLEVVGEFENSEKAKKIFQDLKKMWKKINEK